MVLVETWFTYMDKPQRIQSGQGRNVKSMLIYELYKVYGIVKSRTTVYKAPRNGYYERFSGALHAFLSLLQASEKMIW